MDHNMKPITFEDLYKKHYYLVLKQISWRVKDKFVAEELTQEVFMQLYFEQWNEIKHIKAWLIKTSIFVSYNFFRSEKRHLARIDKAAQHYTEEDACSVEDIIMQKETNREVQSILNQMTEKEKTVLLMQSNGFKYKEIAEALDTNTASIGMLLRRSKKKFEKLYHEVSGGLL